VLPVGPAAATTEVGEDVDGRGPWGLLSAGSATTTTVAEEDVDGGPPRGATGGSDSSHHRS
jgi:hypothetical protein